MYKKLLLASSLMALTLSGCGSRQYYTPEQTYNASTANMGDSIIHYSRDGATLASGNILTKNQMVKLKLEKGFHFINNAKNVAITADSQGNCNIVSAKGTVATAKFPNALVAGTIMGKYLVYVLQNNNFGIYNFETKSIVYNNKSEKAYAIDTRIANPLSIDNLAVIPTLDGKLVILDLSTQKVSKEIYVSTEKSLNNVIFLGRLKNTLIAATPNKVLSISNKGKKELDKAISEVVIDKDAVFVFAKDGNIMQLNDELSVNSEKKFKFAHFSVATVYDDKVYALDKQGYLVVSNKSFSKDKVYQVPEVEGYAFVSNGKIYYDGNIIKLNTLSYE
jgi:outer membrane protein assembly factor BamB